MPSATAHLEAPRAHTRTHWSLVRRLKAGGDEQAWREFYAAYGPLLHGLALKCGLSHEEAEEAVQDTVTSVFKSLPGFRADPAAGSFKNWLFRLARWRITNQFNKRPRYAGALVGPCPGRDGTKTATNPIGRVADESPNALEAAWEAEWQEHALEVALERLKKLAKARHFQAFYLHVIKRQSPGQVARALGTNVAQVYLVKCRLLPVFKRIVRSLDRQPL
jgi:RNA polymerase sigma factor (sigma-70 family)